MSSSGDAPTTGDPAAGAPLSSEEIALLASGDHVLVDDRGVIPLEQVGLNPTELPVLEDPHQISR
jgi:hypothetical protein